MKTERDAIVENVRKMRTALEKQDERMIADAFEALLTSTLLDLNRIADAQVALAGLDADGYTK